MMRRIVLYAALLILGLMVGFGPMWAKSRDNAARLSDATRQLDVARLEITLSSAAIDARRGDYERARQSASSFFTSLRAETDRADGSLFSQPQRAGVQSLYNRRDEVITLLSRSDPASADRLSDLYVSYREIMSK